MLAGESTIAPPRAGVEERETHSGVRSRACPGTTTLAYHRRAGMERGRLRYRNTRKLAQLTGDFDLSRDHHYGPTSSRSSSRYDVMGSDLGISVELGQRLYFFFGDTIRKSNRTWSDCIAYTDAGTDPDVVTPTLAWITGEDPSTPAPFKVLVRGYEGNGTNDGDMFVPSGAFADEASRSMYLFYGYLFDSSVLTKATTFGPTTFQFESLYEFSRDKFATASATTVGSDVFVFGTSKNYRKGSVHLARSRWATSTAGTRGATSRDATTTVRRIGRSSSATRRSSSISTNRSTSQASARSPSRTTLRPAFG